LDYDLAPYVKKSFLKHFVVSIIKSTDDFVKLNIIKMKEKELDEFITKNKSKYLKSVGLTESDIFIENQANLDIKHYNSALFDLMIEGRQSAQGLYHNLNTLESRQGSQVPFTSINIGRDTSTEGRLVTQWLMEASLNGIGKHHLTSIFPISIFQYKKGINADPKDINYDLKQMALESMSKRIYPNWCNCDWSQSHEDENNIDTYFSTINKTVA
jgi:ribonucleoside-triphosphate reductase